MAARKEGLGIGGFLTTDHMECSDFSKGIAAWFSERVTGGLRGIMVSRYDQAPDPERALASLRRTNPSAMLGDYYKALNLSDAGLIGLFAQPGLKVPQEVNQTLSVAQFDIVSLFDDGGVYVDMIHIPFEFLEAEPV